MAIELLPPGRARALAAQPLSYAPVGMVTAPPPPGYARLERRRVLRRRDLAAAGEDLLGWHVQARAGLHVAASQIPLRVGTDVEMRLGIGPLAARIPCRVVEVVDEGERIGFTYGTLPGHPEQGEERFLLERGPDGRLLFTVSAVSRPAWRLARVARPLAALLQHGMADRYLPAAELPHRR